MRMRIQTLFAGRAACGIVTLSVVLAGFSHVAHAEGSRGERIATLLERLTEADALRAADRIEDAGPIYRESLARADALGAVSLPLARAVDGLADFERHLGRRSEAERLYLRSVELWTKLLGPDQPRLAVSLHNLGVLYLDQGDCGKASAILRQAHSIWISSFGEDSEQASNTARALTACLDSQPTATGKAVQFSGPPERPAGESSRHPR